MGTLSQRISSQLQSLQGLKTHLEGINDYLEKVVQKKLPINHQILYQLQDIFNLLPNLNLEEFTQSFAVKTNDQLLIVYIASLVRSVIALHTLIENKVSNREAEKQEKEGDKKKDDQKAKKDSAKGEGEAGKDKDSTNTDSKGTPKKKDKKKGNESKSSKK